MAGTTFTVKIEGLNKMQQVFKQAPQIVEPIYKEAINRSGAILDHNRINPSNVPWRTGELARRWSTSFGALYLRTKPDVDYARAVQYGLPPSPGRYVPAIKARLKNPPLGMWPGFKGRHYMENIINASADGINNVFREAIQMAVKAIKYS